jgi:hypothetical protein
VPIRPAVVAVCFDWLKGICYTWMQTLVECQIRLREAKNTADMLYCPRTEVAVKVHVLYLIRPMLTVCQ